MNFAFSEEQEAFRETLRRFLEARSPTAEVFRLTETPEGFDPAVWKQMACELGLQGVQIPESYGGQGFGFLELGIVFEEMGRVLLCSPYFSTVCLGANAILNAGSEKQKAALLPGISKGETVATLALVDESGSWNPASVDLELRRDGDDWILDGVKRLVTDGALADLVLVVARIAGTRGETGLSLIAVRSDDPGLEAVPVDPLDPTRRIADLHFEGVRGELLGEPGGAAAALERTLDQASVCLAAESVGGTQRCLDAAVEYARTRVQFARPIGSFQAIKHKCADMMVQVESARSAAYYAGCVAAEDGDDLSLQASLAKAYCSDAFFRCAGDALQIFGGVGFTWEYDIHLYLKRAKSTETFLGNAAYHRELVAQQIGLGGD